MNLGDVLDRSAWTFYTDGRTWSERVDGAAPVFCGGSIMSVSWNAHLERYVALYSTPFSNDVMLRTAPSPEGP